MGKKIVLLTLVLVFLLSAMVVASLAQTRTVGVSVGDWFKYGTVDVSWSSNDPNATFPPYDYEWLKEQNETDWLLLSVTEVSGTNVTCQAMTHFKNGTEKIEGGNINIDAGDGNMTFMAVSANLEANDPLYTSGDYSSYKINETIVRTYPGGVRNANHLNITQEFTWTVNQTQNSYYYSMNFYWDRSTGIFIEESWEAINHTGEYLTTWSELSRITESNVWVVPEFPTWASVLILFVVLTFAIAIYKRKPIKTRIN